MESVFRQIPLGSQLSDLYFGNPKLQRFFKYGLWISFQFWIIRAPLVWFMTERMSIHYLLSSFTIGLLLTVAGFFLSEFWIWRKGD